MLNDPHGIRVYVFEKNMKQALRTMSKRCNKNRNMSEWTSIMEEVMMGYLKRWYVWKRYEPLKILSFEKDGKIETRVCQGQWVDPNFFDHMMTMGKFGEYDQTGAQVSFMHPVYPDKIVRLRYHYPDREVSMTIKDKDK